MRLNISHWSKKRPAIEALQALEPLRNLTVRLNTIPPWSGGFIPFARVDHSKYMVVDGRIGWVGTSNWSGDYFDSSRNVELVFNAKEQVIWRIGLICQLHTLFHQAVCAKKGLID